MLKLSTFCRFETNNSNTGVTIIVYSFYIYFIKYRGMNKYIWNLSMFMSYQELKTQTASCWNAKKKKSNIHEKKYYNYYMFRRLIRTLQWGWIRQWWRAHILAMEFADGICISFGITHHSTDGEQEFLLSVRVDFFIFTMKNFYMYLVHFLTFRTYLNAEVLHVWCIVCQFW